MSKPLTVIGKAKELIRDVGKEEAIKVFEKRIADIGEPSNFEDICKLSANETAIDFINGKFGKTS